jgi:hypothetical protein
MKGNLSMLAWVKKTLTRMVGTPDAIAMLVGLMGLALLVTGLGLIYVPAAFIVAGVILMCWSYMAARAIAGRRAEGAR